MLKAIPMAAVLALAAASPALAQEYRYPPDSTTTTSPETTSPQSREERSSEDVEDDQQAQTPETDENAPGAVETLRGRGMSSPNVRGDTVPENPATGLPQPEARGNPKELESVPRP